MRDSSQIRSRASSLVSIVLAGAAWLGVRAEAERLPVLTSIGAVHRLSQSEAIRGYPVHLRAVITYYDPFLNHPRRPILMVTDKTGSIYVALPGETALPLKAGTLLDVTGKSGPGDFAPTIDSAEVRILGEALLPVEAQRKTLTGLLRASDDAPWSEMEGVVESVEVSGGNVTLKLAVNDGEIAATTVKEAGADYERLIDATVRIHGIAGSLFNRQSQMIGVQLLFPGMQTVWVEEEAPARSFDLAASPISALMRYIPGRKFIHRVHLRAAVTLFWPGRLLCLEDGSNALCAETDQTTPLVVGDEVDVLGFPAIGNVTPTLKNATYRSEGRVESLRMTSIDGVQAFGGEHDAQLIQIEGRLVAHDRASQDPTIVVTSGKYTYSVVLPKSAVGKTLAGLEEGSLLRVTGICLVEADNHVFTRHDGYPVAKYFQIMLRSAEDVEVLQRPSWWSVKHTMYLLALALVMTVGVLGWVVYLRMRVKRQTALLLHQATHDGLTGLWNRKAVLDQLQREFAIAARAHSALGVMMLDADHFKQVNDTHGHMAGDAVLKELAHRLQMTLRSFDLTGRYGGEEFLIVVPGCTEEQVRLCGERIRAAVADRPVEAEGVQMKITVSLGATVLNPLHHSPSEALSTADSALYAAKRAGRNRVVVANISLGARESEECWRRESGVELVKAF